MPNHQTQLIATLAFAVVFAFALGLIARRLHLPSILGYLLAGVAIGPHTPGFTGDLQLSGQLAELGVILLMFGVGLHFSIHDLLVVKRTAVVGALAQIAVTTAIGSFLARIWGWGLDAGLVFGLAISVASTVVLLRALDERNLLSTADGRIAIGWLVVEDLAMVVALVLLPAFAHRLGANAEGLAGRPTHYFDAGAMVALTLVKVATFATGVVVVGRRAVPWLLKQASRAGSRELFTLAVLAIALGIAYGSAALFGVSFALGAFFAGVVLSDSELSHRAATESLPLQNAFAVLFFCSVGMLFDPSVLVQSPLAVAAVVLLIVLGKALCAAAIVLLLGHSVRTALIVAASLAQIGEFSFILAGLGESLGLLPAEGRDLILAGALLSITINPIAFAVVNRIGAPGSAHAGSDVQNGRSDQSTGVPACGLENHVIVVGASLIGRVAAEALRKANTPHVVIERDHKRAERLRQNQEVVIQGDALAPGVFEAARAEFARLILVTVSDGYEARHVLERARQINPHAEIVVRSRSEADGAELEARGANGTIDGERDLALSLVEATLIGIGREKGTESVKDDAMRREQAADDQGSDAVSLMEGVPELRPHAK